MAQLHQRTETILRRLVRRDAAAGVRKVLGRTRPEDIAAAMEHLTWAEQRRLYSMMSDKDYAAIVVANLPDASVRELLKGASETTVVELLERMEPDDATDVVDVLPDDLRARVISELGGTDEGLRDLLEWPSDSAGGIMSPLVFKLPQTATCREAIQALQSDHEKLESVYYVYCVDSDDRLVGVTSLRSLLTHAPSTPLVAVMHRDVLQVSPHTDQEEVARFVERYDLFAVPVVDAAGRLLGIVTVDDVIDVLREEAAEDMMLMAGVSENPSDGLVGQALRRAGWLLATTVGGILMAEIIGTYEATLAKVAVLAGFIPVIMGMGGNVGIQSATIAVRGLATGSIQLGGALRFVGREAQVGVLLGLLFAVILGAYGAIRFGPWIGASVATSVALSIAAATGIGSAIPVVLNRLGADPAIATGPFVTTAVDILAIVVYFNVSRALLGLSPERMPPTDERRGVIVGHADLGDADRIVRVLTAEDGRIDVLARGARSSRKRFGGLLDLGNRVRFTLAGRGRLPRFDQVDLVAGVDRARRDLERIALLAYGCEVAGRLAGEGAPAGRLAQLLVVWLDLLEGDALPGVASRQAFEAKALAFSGVLPSLAACAVCGGPGPTHLAFDSGPVHEVCGHGADIGASALARLDVLLHTPLFETPGAEPSPATWALSDLVQHQLGGALRSRALLAEIGG